MPPKPEEVRVSPLAVGQPAPDFDLPDQTGTRHRLADELEAGPVVLFFYPAAMTSGCTREACHFRDLATEFASLGAQRLGISMDSVAKQGQFADVNSLDYPLLSDADGSVAEAYGVRRKLLSPVRRATFVIDQDAVIRDVVTSEMDMAVHADQALSTLAGLAAP
jgi:thioredoxin-dependent peroxiredoxin